MSIDRRALLGEVMSTKQYFRNVSNAFTEDDAGYAPFPGMFTVAQQVGHVAQTVDWLLEAVGRPEGFSLDFEQHAHALSKLTSLGEAHDWLERTFDALADWVRDTPEADMLTPLPDGPIMGGAPRLVIVGANVDHAAHHRGGLSVYLRALGKTPPMPYAPEGISA